MHLEEQRLRDARAQAIGELDALLQAGDSFGPSVIIAQDGPPLPPPKPSWFRGKGDYVMLTSMGVLLVLLSISVLVRHRREAKIRALCGGYLSDGTEVTKYKLPEWWAPSAAENAVTKEELGVAANPSSAESVAPEPVAQFFEKARASAMLNTPPPHFLPAGTQPEPGKNWATFSHSVSGVNPLSSMACV